MEKNPFSPERALLMEMLQATDISQSIYAAAKLGIADLINDEPKSIHQLAEATGTHGPSLYRVLRALAGVGVLHELKDRTFSLSPAGAYLRSDIPESLRPWVLFQGEAIYRSFGELLHTLKTGESAFEFVYGAAPFDFMAKNPKDAQLFDEAMTALTKDTSEAVVEAYDFSGIGKIADIGGGHGLLLATILKANPSMRGVLFDRTRVLVGAIRLLDEAGLTNRCEFVGGSFFKSVPEGCDAYILKSVIHDWNDDHSVEILTNCRRAMREEGKILLVERIVKAVGSTSTETLCSDLTMLVLGGGREAQERTEGEFCALFRAADCKLARVVPTRSDFYVIEAMSA